MIYEFKTYLMKSKGYSRYTAIAYGKDLSAFAMWMHETRVSPRWSTISQEDIEIYVQKLHDAGKSPATINRNISSVRQFYNWMIKSGWMTNNPARYIEGHKMTKRIPNTIPTTELKNAIQHSAGTIRVMMILLANTGLRIQEMLDIDQQDIDYQNGRIKVNGKGAKQRYVYLTDGDMAELKEYCQGRPARIFGNINQRDARRCIYEHLRRFSNARQLSPHAIRHTFATNMAKNGANATTIATILGHESIKTTQKYIDLGQSNIRELQLQFANYN